MSKKRQRMPSLISVEQPWAEGIAKELPRLLPAQRKTQRYNTSERKG